MSRRQTPECTGTLSKLKVHLIVFALGVSLYVNSLHGDLLFDDNEAIVTNRDVRPSTPLKHVFLNDFWGVPISRNDSHKSYRPLTVLTFRWNFALHGLHPCGYHLINVFLHGLVSALFFEVCVVIFGGDIAPALAAGLLFAVHPIHTEAVSSVVGRAELLAAVYYLLSFRCYCKAVYDAKDVPVDTFSYGYLWMAIVLCGISTLCKETGITVLAACVTYDLVYACRLNGRDVLLRITALWHTRPTWFQCLLRRVLLLSAALVVFLTLRIVLLAGGTATSFVESDNPTLFEPNIWTRVRTYSYLCALNIWTLMCPLILCYDWSMDSIPRLKDNQDPRNLVTISAAITMFILVYYGLFGSNSKACENTSKQECERQVVLACEEQDTLISGERSSVIQNHIVSAANGRVPMLGKPAVATAALNLPKLVSVIKRRQVLTMGLCMMVAPFIPASNLFFPVGFVVAERVLYLPSMGYCLMVALALRVFMHNRTEHTTNDEVFQSWLPRFRLPPALTVVFYGYLIVLASKTFLRNFDWVSTESLAVSGLRANPGNAKIHLTMGNVLANKGFRNCEQFYRQALDLRPHYTAAWTNLGLILLNTERPREAEEAYLEAIRLKPDSADANTNMGHLCRIQERWKEADERYRVALKRRPHDPTLHYNIGLVNEKMDRLEVAKLHYNHVLMVEPNENAGFALASLIATTNKKHSRLKDGTFTTGKRFKEAEKAYENALHYHPNNANGWLQLGKLLLWNEQIDKSELQFRQATRLNPNLAEAHYYLGQALEKKRLPHEAVKAYKMAIQVDRGYQPALLALKQIDAREIV